MVVELVEKTSDVAAINEYYERLSELHKKYENIDLDDVAKTEAMVEEIREIQAEFRDRLMGVHDEQA